MTKGKAGRDRAAIQKLASEVRNIEGGDALQEAEEETAIRSVARRGRPRLPEGEGKRYPLGIRTTKELRERLEAAAKASGRSLAQEVEFRLERSYEQDRFNKLHYDVNQIPIALRRTKEELLAKFINELSELTRQIHRASSDALIIRLDVDRPGSKN
jgi:hypothetical protein